jgi:cyclohexanone monooxygenase
MHFVADKCDMWPHVQLSTEIVSAEFQEDSGYWLVWTADADEFTCRYFISAVDDSEDLAQDLWLGGEQEP